MPIIPQLQHLARLWPSKTVRGMTVVVVMIRHTTLEGNQTCLKKGAFIRQRATLAVEIASVGHPYVESSAPVRPWPDGRGSSPPHG